MADEDGADTSASDFNVDHLCWDTDTNEHVYDLVGRRCLDSAFEGINCTGALARAGMMLRSPAPGGVDARAARSVRVRTDGVGQGARGGRSDARAASSPSVVARRAHRPQTHTMMGTDQQPGVIPLLARDLFERAAAAPAGHRVDVAVSMCQIYGQQEIVSDLLAPTVGTRLAVRGGKAGQFEVQGLTWYAPKTCVRAGTCGRRSGRFTSRRAQP